MSRAADQVARKEEMFAKAVTYMAEAIPALVAASSNGPAAAAPATSRPGAQPLLYGPNGAPIRHDAYYSFRRSAAKREGSMKTWIPQRLFSQQQEQIERERIVERSIDLDQSDPHAHGIADNFAITTIGSGLIPLPIPDSSMLRFNADQVRNDEELQRVRNEQKANYQSWYPIADAGGRMNFGAVQFLTDRMLVTIGEYLVLLPMLDDATRPFSLACQVIHPLRLKTPVDLLNNPTIKDGVEIGAYSEPIAYWIKKSSTVGGGYSLPDVSANFLRVRAKQGHRRNVLHGFIQIEPEQVRGLPASTPALKFFRDLNDYLDAELVSNIVTAAFAMFIEVQNPKDPWQIAGNLSSLYDDSVKQDGSTERTRYQEIVPGTIMYGNKGEMPHTISAVRPGATFEPFTKIIKKAIAIAHYGMPYAIAFNDVEDLNFAGFRGAMLSAWRIYMYRRATCGQMFCQPIYTMLQEEAYLRGRLNVPDFYANMDTVTRCDWRGSPKGDIEPVKQAQSNILLRDAGLKTDETIIAETEGEADVAAVYDQLARERQMRADRGLAPAKPLDPATIKDDDPDRQQEQGDEQ
jgi:lambda family phage portal protein